MELNEDVREQLRPTVEPDGRTMVKIAIPTFSVRTLKFDNYAN